MTRPIGAQTTEFTARVAQGGERDRIWDEQKRDAPARQAPDKKTTKIPVVVLDPVN